MRWPSTTGDGQRTRSWATRTSWRTLSDMADQKRAFGSTPQSKSVFRVQISSCSAAQTSAFCPAGTWTRLTWSYKRGRSLWCRRRLQRARAATEPNAEGRRRQPIIWSISSAGSHSIGASLLVVMVVAVVDRRCQGRVCWVGDRKMRGRAGIRRGQGEGSGGVRPPSPTGEVDQTTAFGYRRLNLRQPPRQNQTHLPVTPYNTKVNTEETLTPICP